MIIFLYGQDTYRSRQELNGIIDKLKSSNNGLRLSFFDGKDINLEDIENEVQTTSMFKEKKLVVLTNAFVNSGLEEDLLGFIRKRIAHYKAPKKIVFSDDLPKSPQGKILKKELRKPYWKDFERSVA